MAQSSIKEMAPKLRDKLRETYQDTEFTAYAMLDTLGLSNRDPRIVAPLVLCGVVKRVSKKAPHMYKVGDLVAKTRKKKEPKNKRTTKKSSRPRKVACKRDEKKATASAPLMRQVQTILNRQEEYNEVMDDLGRTKIEMREIERRLNNLRNKKKRLEMHVNNKKLRAAARQAKRIKSVLQS